MVPKLRFKEFCGEWEEKRLGDVCTIIGGGTPSTKIHKYWEGDIPWISSSDINNENFNINISRYITNEALEKSSTKLCPKNTIHLVSRVGVGKVGISDYEICTSQDFLNLTDIKSNKLFLAYSISNILKLITMTSQGTSIKGITSKEVKNLIIKIPSLPEQTKIADFLSTVDDKIQNQQDKITHLENIKKGFMQKIFSRKIRFKDDGGEEFPEWEEKRIKDILKEVVEKTTILDQYEVISSTSNGIYTQKEYFNRDIASKNNIGYKVLKINQIVLSPQNLWMGNINLNKKFKIGMVSPSYKIFNIVERNNINFIGYFLRTPKAFYEYKISSEQGASIVRRNLNMDLFNNIKIMLPCLKEQEKIADFLLSFDKKIDAEKENLEHLKVVKKGLLQQMFV